MDEKIRCYNCMELKPVRFRICPHCGYAEDEPYDPDYAPPGTELDGRYTLGVKIGHNSEGANYIGYNASIGCKVLIREYMPVGLCKRIRGRATISVFPDRVVTYKTLMEDFTVLNKNLAKMRNLPHIIPTLDIFSANNTTYVVYEYLEGIKLIEYLRENAGELTWHQVSAMFPTFFTTLSLMHNHNVIHMAISPDTIYVTPRGELRLCGFSLREVRTMNMRLSPEIFQGYAAPEQYNHEAKQGTFTDVYSICAVLYRLLTGCQPVDAPSRGQQDNLSAPYELNPNIPRNVSDAIMKGMCLDARKRTQTITELVTQLFEQNTENTETQPVIPAESAGRKKKLPHHEEETEIDYALPESENILERVRMPLIIAVMTLCILLVMAIIILSFINRDGSVSVNSSQTETTTATEPLTENNIVTESVTETETATEAQGDSQMPSLIGTNYTLKKEQLETDGWLYLEPIYAYSEEYGEGLIMEQAIEAGQPFNSGTVVKVVVSKGSAYRQLPDYTGKTLLEFEAELEAMGLTNYNTEAVVDYQFESGYVMHMNKEIGEIFDLSADEPLKIFYASNPETTPPPATEPVIITNPPAPETTEPTEENTDESGIPLETAPNVAPGSEDSSEYTEDAPETAPDLYDDPDDQTAPVVGNLT